MGSMYGLGSCLKRRLEFMNKELALCQHKLRKHTAKKEVKLTENKIVFVHSSSDYTTGITDDFPCNLETSIVEANNCNVNIVGKCGKEFLSRLSEHNLSTTTDAVDVLVSVTLASNHNTHIASKPEVTQNNISVEQHVAFSAGICEHASAQDFSVLEEKNSSFKQRHISNNNSAPAMAAGYIEISTPSTPKKLVTGTNDNSNQSPILMQTNCVPNRSAKPETRFMAKRMKGLLSTARSKRNNCKQIPLALNHNVFCKVKSSLYADGLSLPSVATDSEDPTDTDNDALPVAEDTVHKEQQRCAFVTFPSCTVDGKVLTAFYEDHFLVLVQELQINFWSFVRRKSQWIHLGLLPRQHFDCGISMGCLGSRINLGSERMFMCMELWTSNEKEQTELMCVIYSYSIAEARFKFCRLDLKRVHGCIKNIKFCILPELSVVVTWSHCDASNTKIVKFSIDTESQLVLKSTDLVPVAGTVNSLHFLKGCRAVIIGDSTSQVFLWNHCTGALVKIIQSPRSDVKLQWADENQGFLFAAVTTLTHVELTTANITTSKWKQVRKFLLPESYKLTGINVECGKMTAVFLEGFMCWDLRTGVLMSETDNTNEY